MIWSLVRILTFIGLTAGLAYLGGVLIETDGNMRVVALGYEITLGPLQAAILAILVVISVWLLLRISGLIIATFRFINGDETAISRYFDRNRERRGFEALADGMMALASGEGRLAMAKASKAERYLARPELTNLLAAQAAEMAGDRAKAQEVYKRLLKDERTRFVGVRGIMKQKLEEGDTTAALKLAERAFSLKPKHDETSDILLQLQAQAEDWGGARNTLGAKLRSGAIPRDLHRRRDAVLALADANAKGGDDAQALALESNRLSPDLVPAAAAAARVLIGQGKTRQAAKVIRRAWEAHPNPDLLGAFGEIAPDETPQERLARFETLFRLAPDDPESVFGKAELLIAADQFEDARLLLDPELENRPTARTLALLAVIEKNTGADDEHVRATLSRALQAPRGATWVCDNCQTIAPQWASVCSNCSGLDTLSWRAPVEPISASDVAHVGDEVEADPANALSVLEADIQDAIDDDEKITQPITDFEVQPEEPK